MDLGDAEELQEFRNELRRWLETNQIDRELGEPDGAFLKRWHQTLFRGGWVGLSWPTEIGGRGLTPTHEVVLNDEIGAAGAPDAPRIGYLGRAILEFGTTEQVERLIPGLLSGEEYWCQGFSEPDAGSDLANLSTRAERTETGYIITGQKVWTTYADYADYCLLLARTGEAGGRHRGISAFVLPMRQPGVEVRPLRANTGETEFSEIFLERAFVDEANRIGAEGDGWPIAMMTVAYERGAADVGYLSKFGAAIKSLRALARGGSISDPAVWRSIGEIEMHYSVLEFHVRRRMRERELTPGVPGSEMSVDKVLMTTVDQAIYDTAMRLLGGRPLFEVDHWDWLVRFLYSRGASIYGGTQQVQLNILAQRVLGLPMPSRRL